MGTYGTYYKPINNETHWSNKEKSAVATETSSKSSSGVNTQNNPLAPNINASGERVSKPVAKGDLSKEYFILHTEKENTHSSTPLKPTPTKQINNVRNDHITLSPGVRIYICF